ncbi:MAG: MFS transporter [Gammaproteobacteria bacterium]|nr:MFS transporter [Gammaproteobacteria bacterium]
MDRTLYFYLFCIAQTVFVFSNVLILFALGVWIYLDSDSLTKYGIFIALAYLAELIITPAAGAIFDRFQRDKIFISCAAILILIYTILALVIAQNQLSEVICYLLVASSSLVSGLHRVSYNATIPAFAKDSRKLSRYNGSVYLGISIANLAAPIIAGILLAEFTIASVVYFSIICCATVLLLSIFVKIPHCHQNSLDKNASILKKIVSDTKAGYLNIKNNTGLKHFLYLHSVINFTRGFVIILFTPMVLSFSDAYTLGLLRSTAGMGMLLGGVVMSIWIGPKKLIVTLLYSLVGTGVFLLLTGLKSSAIWIGICVFFIHALTAILSTVGYTLWQNNVENNIIGRVFAFRDMAINASLLIAYITAPLAAQHIFEPFMNSQNQSALLISWVIGHGDGRGIGLLYIIIGLITMLLAVYIWTNKPMRSLKNQ